MLIFIAFLYGTALFYLFRFFPLSGVVLFIAAAVYTVLGKKVLLLPVIVLGISCAFLRFPPQQDPYGLINKEIRVTGSFAPGGKVVRPGTRLEPFVIDTALDEVSGEEMPELGDSEIDLFSDFEADTADRYELLLKTGKDKTRLNPGGATDSRPSGSVLEAHEKGRQDPSVAGRFNSFRNSLNAHVLKSFREEPAALIVSITTGETGYLGRELKEAFNATGLAHILSISGTHFGLFSVVVFGAFVFLIKRLPYRALQRLTVYLSPSQAAALLSLPFMLFYLGISGGSLPAIRSFVMISLFLAGLFLGRKGLWLNSLCFAAFILVLWDPGVILSLSFQLSFIAVLFIGFSVEKKDEDTEEEGNRLLRLVKNSVKLTLAASIGSSALVADYFHYFPVISPLANLIVAPLIGFVLVPLSLMSSFSFLAAGSYHLAPFVEWAAELSVALVKGMARIPFADLKIPAFPPVLCIFFYAGFLLYLLAGRKRWLLVIPFVPFFIYAFSASFDKKELSVTFLDVGQGDSAVVEMPDGKTLLIDTGRTGREAAAYLKYRGKKELDAVVLSHAHPDHTGGLEFIRERFPVKELWDNGLIDYPGGMIKETRHRVLERGDSLGSAGCTVTALHPYREFYTLAGDGYEEDNNASLVLRIEGPKSSFLFPGDVEDEAEEDLAYLKKWLRADVIKMPHHGSRTSANEGFLAEVSPSVAVISVGRDNAFGHPSPEVLEKLEGRIILRTDLDGAVKITGTEKGLVIKTYGDSMLERADGPKREWSNILRLFSTW